MAATRIISGALREIWRETAHQPTGDQTFMTNIRISQAQLSRVRGLLVLDAITGTPAVAIVASVVGGFLSIRISNLTALTTIDWTLDIQLTHSINQATDAVPGAYISVVNGAAVGGAVLSQNLAQTYNFGTLAAHQTMVIDDVNHGGGIIVDASTAAVTAAGTAFEVRANSGFATPIVFSLASANAADVVVQLAKSRGTVAAPAVIQVADDLGTISWQGYTGAAFAELAHIYVRTAGPAPFPTRLVFGITDHAGVAADVITIQDTGELAGPYVQMHGNVSVIPDVDTEGAVGIASQRWGEVHAMTVNAYSNVILGGAAVGGGADQTVLLPNSATIPAPQANQTYLGSTDFTGGTTLAVLAISAEEPAVVVGVATVDYLIPIMYNGEGFYLHATRIVI